MAHRTFPFIFSRKRENDGALHDTSPGMRESDSDSPVSESSETTPRGSILPFGTPAKRARLSTLDRLSVLRDSLPLSVSEANCEAIFSHYRNVHDVMDEDSWKRFSADTAVPCDSIGFHALLHLMRPESTNDHVHLGRADFWTVTWSRFVTGLNSLRCDNVAQMPAAMLELENRFSSEQGFFSAVFVDCFFLYCVGGGRTRCYLPTDSATLLLLQMMPSIAGWVFTEPFVQYVRERRVHSLNLDQWRMFLHFALHQAPDLSSYSTEDAYPSLLDEFVDWMVPGKFAANLGSSSSSSSMSSSSSSSSSTSNHAND
jgi:hypothetical protein